MTFDSINPATGEKLETFEEHSASQIQEILRRAAEAQDRWRQLPFSGRAKALRRAAEILRRDALRHAEIMAREMGKPLAQGKGESEKCAWVCEYYAENAERFLSREEIPTDATRSYVTFEPLGVVLSIMPWNFPFWQVFRFAAPALMAGNAVVLKHALNVPRSALMIEALLREAGLPAGVFQTLLVNNRGIQSVIEHPVIRAVTLTGSTRAGRAVASQAGAVLKKTVLELGGSDPYIILEDADLDAAAETCVASRFINSGQSCIAAKRFIVPERIRKAFEERLIHHMRAQKMGDPLAQGTTIGPLARRDLRDELHRQVLESLAKGAKLLLGGTVLEGPGAFYPPTVLTGVTRGMPAYDEETFGPVAAILPVRDEEEAIRVANDSPYGLGAAIFTQDVKRGEEIAARRLETGCCFVNAFVKSDPRLPFGGIKESGYGRELSIFGIREFVNIKTVYVK